MTSRSRKWLHGLGAAFIGGGATALTAAMGLAGAHSVGADVTPLTFKKIGAVFIFSAISSTAFYLKQSPLPPEEPDETQETKP
jgi:hypothetical protein